MKKAITTIALLAVVLVTSSFESTSNLSVNLRGSNEVSVDPPTTGGVYVGGGRKEDVTMDPPTTGGVYVGGGRKEDFSKVNFQSNSFAADRQSIIDVRKVD